MVKRFSLVAADVAIIAIGTLFAVMLRENFDPPRDWLVLIEPYLAATIVTAILVSWMFGLDRAIWRMSSMIDYLTVCAATAAIVALTLGIGFIYNRLDGVARSLPPLQFIVVAFGLIGVRVLARLRYEFRSRSRLSAHLHDASITPATTSRAVVVVGAGRIAELYIQSFEELGASRGAIVGVVGLHDRHSGRLIHQHRVLGDVDVIDTIIQDLEIHGIFVDRLVLTVPLAHLEDRARQRLLDVGKTSKITLDLFADRFATDDVATALTAVATTLTAAGPCPSTAAPLPPLPPLPLTSGAVAYARVPRSDEPQGVAGSAVACAKVPPRGPYWSVKRPVDAIGALVLIVALSPVFIIVAVLVAADVGAPLWFWQQRPGAGGRPFRVYKFRTMRGAYDWNGQRVRDEDRSSPLGRTLRRLRLDELPQLWNILIGQMSFVGPRPLLAIDQCVQFGDRLAIRPGLTGWAQVNGGRLLSIPDKMALDMWYIDNASLWIDLRVLIGTLAMVAFGETRNEAAVAAARSVIGAQTEPTMSIRAPTGRLAQAQNDALSGLSSASEARAAPRAA